MKTYVVVQYLLESETLEQIYIIKANSENEASQKIENSYGTMLAIICIDDVKKPYQYFRK